MSKPTIDDRLRDIRDGLESLASSVRLVPVGTGRLEGEVQKLLDALYEARTKMAREAHGLWRFGRGHHADQPVSVLLHALTVDVPDWCDRLAGPFGDETEGEPNKPPIQVWPFHEAPEPLKEQSPHGGDEDWLALVPPHLKGEYISWLAEGGWFGVCSVSESPQPDGSVLYIGAHA